MWFLFFLPCVLSLELPRGVPFSKSSLYQIGKPFSCLDGTAVLPWYKVNDDYCDCLDGSDEPGTSACSNGLFSCRDIQYKTQSIRSAFVNDGICDCCDGSDEYDGRTTCTSTCGILAAAVEQARSAIKGEVERGRQLYKEYVEQLKIRKSKAAEELERRQAEQSIEEQSRSDESESSTTSIPSDPIPPEPVAPESNSDDQPSEQSPEPQTPDKDPDHPDTPSEEDKEHIVPPPIPNTPPPKPIDYGPGGAFEMLDDLDGCLEFSDQQYTYELCGFKEIYQKNIGQTGHGTSLGSWKGWVPNERSSPEENQYEIMLFVNGAGCWNGPSRSTKVHVRCSDTNKIVSVSEPSRCEYTMQLLTPAACFDEPEVLFKRVYPD